MPIDSSTTPLHTFAIGETPTSADVNGNNDHWQERVDREAAYSAQFAQDVNNTTGLTFAYYGGTVSDGAGTVTTVTDDTIILTASDVNYIEVDPADGTVAANLVGWTAGLIPLFQVTTGVATISAVLDVRPFSSGGGGGGTVTDVTGSGPISSSGGTTPDISLDNDSVTDTYLANQTVDQTTALGGTPNVGKPGTLFGRMARILDLITGETNWYDTPNTDLAATATHIAAAAPHSGHLKADGTVASSADQDLGGFKYTNAADGVAADDLATVGQLTLSAAGFAPREAVRVATIAALPANSRTSNTLTASANGSINNTGIDGITNIAIGDRILVKNEATGANNGVYEVDVVGTAGTPWEMTRATDMDTSGEAVLGAYYPVEEGSLANTAWYLATASVTLNTTALVFTQDPTGNGEVNTASSLGGDADVFKQKSGVDLQFRGVTAGLGIDLTENANDIEIAVDPTEFDLDDVGGTLAVTKGGTGLTTVASGELPYGSGANVYSKLAGNATATNKFLQMVSGTMQWAILARADMPVFLASGASHAQGAVPTPGATAGTNRFLREDASWAEPPNTGLSATSTTSVTIPATVGGSKSWFIGLGKAFVVGQHIRAAVTATPTVDYIGGIVTSYSAGTIALTVDEFGGAVAAHADWTISINGAPGAFTGTLDAISDVVITSPATGGLLAYDGSNWIDRTITDFTAETTVADSDEVLIYDASATAHRKMTKANFTINKVTGPASSTDNALVRFDSTTGKLVQDSTVTLDDTGAITVPEMAAPSTPASGKVALYAKSDGLLYSKDDAGTETVVTGGGGGGSTVDVTFTAGEAIAIRSAVYVEIWGGAGTDGRVYKTDSTYSSKSLTAWFVGFATAAAASAGDSITVRVCGVLGGFSSLTPGAVQYASGTPGGTTETLPTNARRVGIAISATEILVNTRGDNTGVVAANIGTKGYFSGGTTGSNSAVTDKITFATDTTAAAAGANLSTARQQVPGLSEGATKGYFAGGFVAASSAIADKVTFGTDTTAATATADLSSARYGAGAVSERSTKGYFSGGDTGSVVATGDKITFSTDTTAAAASANLSVARRQLIGLNEASTKGYFCGGSTGTQSAVTDKIIFATDTTAAQSSANLSTARFGPAACGDGGSKGYIAGGHNGAAVVATADKLTFTTDTTAASSSSNLSASRNLLAGASQGSDKGYFCGGSTGSVSAVGDKITFSTDTTAAQSSANLSAARSGVGGFGDVGL